MNKLDKIHEHMTQGEPPADSFNRKEYGDQVLCLRVKDLRRLGELDEGVEIIKIMEAPRPRSPYELPYDWIPHPREVPVYLHIRHPFCVRCPPGSIMVIEDFDEFQKRFAELEQKYGPVP